MTLPPVVRIFFAIDLSPSVKTTLDDFITQIKKKAKSKGIRWTRAENLHITLQFLAAVRAEDIPKMIENVREQLDGKFNRIAIHFDSLALFPSPYRPRVIVLNILPQKDLALLSEQIGKGIEACNYEIESRPFRAHLTLGRIKHTNINLNFVTELAPPSMELINIEEIILFRSEPQPEGSRYTVIEKISFKSQMCVK